VGKVPTAAMFAVARFKDPVMLRFCRLVKAQHAPRIQRSVSRRSSSWGELPNDCDVVGPARCCGERNPISVSGLSHREAIIAQEPARRSIRNRVIGAKSPPTPCRGAKLQGAPRSGSTYRERWAHAHPKLSRFAEVLGLTEERRAQRFRLAKSTLAAAPGLPGSVPTAPYSTPEGTNLAVASISSALRTDVPRSAMHVRIACRAGVVAKPGAAPSPEQLAGVSGPQAI